MTLWIDVEDLFEYARFASRPSGIQRLSLEIYSALVATPGAAIGFVRHARDGRGYRIVAWEDVRGLYERMAHARPPSDRRAPAPEPPAEDRGRRWTAHIPDELRTPLGQAARAQAAALGAGWRALQALPGVLRRAASGQRDRTLAGRPLEQAVQPGDVLCIFGAPWTNAGAGMVEQAKRDLGLRFALLVHDLVPVLRPEYAAPAIIRLFSRWLRRCLPLADLVFTNSACTARDLETWAERSGVALARPVVPVPIGTGFPAMPAEETGGAPRPLPPPGSYALFVSTIEARKNHALAFRVWRRLTQEMPAERVPALVFAGRVGWMVADLMQQIRNSGYLDGRLILVEDPSDAELAALYAGCRFTLFPSHYEGWGLPVTESLGFGKACIASAGSSVPEAGGPFCLYIDPDDATGATALIRRAIEEEGLIAGLEARIRAEFRPVPWSETADVLLRHIAAPPAGAR